MWYRTKTGQILCSDDATLGLNRLLVTCQLPRKVSLLISIIVFNLTFANGLDTANVDEDFKAFED
jgi:hypothetical protein